MPGMLKGMAALAAAVLLCSVTAGSVSAATAKKKLTQNDFVHAEGQNIIGTDGKKLEIRGMSLGNEVYGNPALPPEYHHSESTYKELSEMGFNCVRFYLNYGIFESDAAPYKYKKSGAEWLDKNVKWAKKYGMGIIFNMHVPQGGYQSQGNGMGLWEDSKNQDRLASLWKYIAKRYASEPTVWGYGIVNEPIVPALPDKEKTAAQYTNFVKRMASEIRSVSPYQMIFTERLCASRNAETGASDWTAFSNDEAFALLDDKNTVYEFHCYAPHKFTHQYAEWTGNGGMTASYPSDETISIEYENTWTGCERGTRKSSDGEWMYFETVQAGAAADRNVVCAALNVNKQNDGEASYFDDIVITEISPDGKKKTVASYSFDSSMNGFGSWSSNGTGKAEFCPDDGHSGKGCVKISGNTADFVSSCGFFAMNEKCRYTVSGYVKSSAQSAVVRMDFAKAKKVMTLNKDYLDSEIKPYADFSEKHSVPVFLGEFGVIRYGFEENRNGAGWVSDMIDICRKYGIGFNYHTYHESSFGLYLNSGSKPPAEQNKELAGLFRKKLKKKTK